MKHISDELRTHLLGGITTLATCWKVTRRDSVVMGFTDGETDVCLEGVMYRASTGFKRSALRSSYNLNPDNMDITGFLDCEAIAADDLRRGLYDNAAVEVFVINYQNPTMGKLQLERGHFGEVQLRDGTYTVEIKGLMDTLSQTIGQVYSPHCRAELGDTRCGLDLDKLTIVGEVTHEFDCNFSFIDKSKVKFAGPLKGGLLHMMSGANIGMICEIKNFDTKTGALTLYLPFLEKIRVGDRYKVTFGCNKMRKTCKDVFDNIINFRGEPFVPGLHKIRRGR